MRRFTCSPGFRCFYPQGGTLAQQLVALLSELASELASVVVDEDDAAALRATLADPRWVQTQLTQGVRIAVHCSASW